jgi:hypothetical protein
MIPVMILTYRGIDYFDKWWRRSNYSDKFQFFIIDNGKQNVPATLASFMCHQTEVNTGCPGGYNLMMDIGFTLADKIICAQEDGQFTEEMLQRVYDNTTDDICMGAYGNGFDCAIMGITRQYREVVGRWDENFLFARREDNDFKWRSGLVGKRVTNLGYNPYGNVSVVDNDDLKWHDRNIDYYYEKWGNPERYIHPFNNPFLNPFGVMPIRQAIKDVYGEITEFPSITEFRRYNSIPHVYYPR